MDIESTDALCQNCGHKDLKETSSLKHCATKSTTTLRFWISLFLIFLCLPHLAQARRNRPRGNIVGNKPSSRHDRTQACLGTTARLTKHQDGDAHYQMLRKRFANCTYIKGNLEITWLDFNRTYDLSFLSDIEEVTGYVLIAYAYAREIPLRKLKIIRGRELFLFNKVAESNTAVNGDNNSYALVLMGTSVPQSDSGAKHITMNSLREISQGDIFIGGNHNWCYSQLVSWRDILNTDTQELKLAKTEIHGTDVCPKNEVKCHSDCPSYKGEQYCWGPEKNDCQTLSRLICAEQCGNQRCFGDQVDQCCHTECAGGCSGKSVDTCHACKNFFNGTHCVQKCELPRKYNFVTYKFEPNDKFQYAFGTHCVPKCPPSLYADAEYAVCLRSCGEGKYPKDMMCEPCKGACPKICMAPERKVITIDNIESFRNCTKVTGTLQILDSTFNGDTNPSYRHAGMQPDQLWALRDVEEITGILYVFAKHSRFTSLKYFRNLRTILGHESTGSAGSGLTIVKTSLESLDLRSLESVKDGVVHIQRNTKLCYASTIKWAKVAEACKDDRCKSIITGNKPTEHCEKEGAVCSPECDASQGCWGPSPKDCIACAIFLLNTTKECVSSCDESEGFYVAAPGQCEMCDANCKDKCSGPGPDKCSECKNFHDGIYCVEKCPQPKYPDTNSTCQLCHDTCIDGPCTGPSAMLGAGGCSGCKRVIKMSGPEGEVAYECSNRTSCPPNFHEVLGKQLMDDPYRDTLFETNVCLRCDEECINCNGYGSQKCDSCRNYWLPIPRNTGVYECVKDCPVDTYPKEVEHNSTSGETQTRQECLFCHAQCSARDGCWGPLATQCNKCKNVAVPTEKKDVEECVPRCPENLPLPQDGHCKPREASSQESKQKETGMIVGIVVGAVAVITVIIITVLCLHRAKSKERTMRLSARMSGIDEAVPLTPTDTQPDLSRLKIIKESELKRGGIIGSGAFGTVYKGVWRRPEGDNANIPVAIKVLQESSPGHAQELLDEARIMCSVDHTCCVRILAVCLGSQMMLVTQLMPLGCLLEYVRRNKTNIGSKTILNWCTQIARGMGHLEELGIVHRDLAARNVLVQSPHLVKITDFGLAKLLDIDEEVFQATGGKMPIKWLALECISQRVFTHKSDVWSFGVTIWELCSYGQRPYENIRAVDVPDLLEKGERLSQPSICTIDVYMILIKCWMKDPDSRPGFRNLVEEFAKMARDPGRYLATTCDRLQRFASTPEERVNSQEDCLNPSLTPSTSAAAADWSTLDSGFDSLAKYPYHSRTSAVSSPDVRPIRERKYGHLENRTRSKRDRVTSEGQNRYSQDPLALRHSGEDMMLEGATAGSFADADGYLEPVTPFITTVNDGGPDRKGVFNFDAEKKKREEMFLNNPEYFIGALKETDPLVSPSPKSSTLLRLSRENSRDDSLSSSLNRSNNSRTDSLSRKNYPSDSLRRGDSSARSLNPRDTGSLRRGDSLNAEPLSLSSSLNRGKLFGRSLSRANSHQQDYPHESLSRANSHQPDNRHESLSRANSHQPDTPHDYCNTSSGSQLKVGSAPTNSGALEQVEQVETTV